MANRFENVIIIGRPGSGKSEVVNLLRKTPLPLRTMYFHVGDFIELDDFVYLNTKLQEDNVWEQTGLPRKYSKRVEDGAVITDPNLWDFCLERINVEAMEKNLSNTNFYKENTMFIEFSRGGEETYGDSLAILSDEVLSKSVILYLDITYEEALLRNEIRYRRGQEDTTLHHKVPLLQMESLYRTNDWNLLTMGQESGHIKIRNNNIPFITLFNQPAPANDTELAKRLSSALHALFSLKYGAPIPKLSNQAVKFDHLIILGRPASGKSEFIDFMKQLSMHERLEDFHMGYLEEVDDYPMLAEMFQEDELWKKITGKRKYTTLENDVHVIQDISLYNFAANRINNLIMKRYVPRPEFYDDRTLFIEFSRGGMCGYSPTIKMLDPKILKRSAIVYIKTSFEECWRRNVARYDEKRKFSVLAHMVPREQMERLYLRDDWGEMTADKTSGVLTINDTKVPFVTLDNEVESKEQTVLNKRYRAVLDVLIENYGDIKRTPEPVKKSKKVEHFENLFVFGRPAGGKSEFISFLKNCDAEKRKKKFFVAPFKIVDDFLSLWELGENEGILEKMSIPRKITETVSDGIVVADRVFFDFVSEKINRVYGREYQNDAEYFDTKSLLIEFSRGGGINGYLRSLSGLSQEILKRGSIIYIKVSYDEALRRNEARYQEKLKHSVMAHKVPEKAMEMFYRQDDWNEITLGKASGVLKIKGIDIPFVTMDNEVEDKNDLVMEVRYANALASLFDLWHKKGV